MQSYLPHRYIENMAHAAREAGLPVALVSFGNHSTPWYLKLPVGIRNVLNPFLLLGTLRRQPQDAVMILREFHTVPLLFVVPFLLPYRQRLYLVNIHNLQRAHTRWLDRLGFRLLFRLRFRFVFPESDAGVAQLGITPSSHQTLVLPFTLPALSVAPARNKAATLPTVGFVGRTRAEKRIPETLDLVAKLRAEGTVAARILVGSPEERVRREAEAHGFEVRDTTEMADYEAAIGECDVVVFAYEKAAYYYRSSGLILDAAVLGTAIVCPDYPVFRTQLLTPRAIGSTFSTPEDIGNAIMQAYSLTREKPEHFAEYLRFRSPQRLAARMAKALGVSGTATEEVAP